MDDIRTPKDALDFLDTVEKTLSGPLVFEEKPAISQAQPERVAPEKPLEQIREPRIPMEAPQMLIDHPEITLPNEPETPSTHDHIDPESFLRS